MNNQFRQWLKRIPGIYQMGRWYNQLIEARIEKQRQLSLKNNGATASQLIYQALQETELNYFITFGSLLGLCREGRFMAHDNDLDYGLLVNNESDWDILQEALAAYHFQVERYFLFQNRITEMTFRYDGLVVDFFAYYTENDNKMTAYIYKRERDVSYPTPHHFSVYRSTTLAVTGIVDQVINGLPVRVPENATSYLADVYTDNWRIPDPHWVSTKSACYFEVPGELAMQHTGSVTL